MGSLFSRMTMRRMMTLAIVLPLVLILLMSGLLMYILNQWTRSKADEEFTLISSGIERQLAGAIDQIEWVAKTIAYSPFIQTYLLSDQPGRVIELGAFAEEMLRKTIEPTPNIRNITFVAANSRKLEYAHMNELLKSAFDYYGFSDDIALDEPFFSKIFYVESGQSRRPYIYYFFPVISILPSYVRTDVPIRENFAICAVLWDISATTSDIVAPLSERGLFALIGDDILSSSIEPSDDQRQWLLQVPDGISDVRAEDGRQLCFSAWMTGLDIRFVYMAPEVHFTRDLMPIVQLCYALLLLPTGLVVMLMMVMVRSITRPVGRIVWEMSKLSDYHAGERVYVPTNPDTALLARGINSMLDRISADHEERMFLQEQVLRAQIDRHQAELLSHRSKVNPHFLFNTLECIRSMAQARSFAYIEQILGAMTGMFQYSLNAKPIVSLRQEIAHASNYLHVIQIRTPDRFQFRVNVTDEALDHPIHAMVLQPMIENAVTHAFKNKRPPCIIDLRGWLDGQGHLRLRIVDNGSGIDRERQEQIKQALDGTITLEGAERVSIGLVNIFRRMRYTFGEACRMRVEAAPGHYTLIELVVPNEIR